jgi:hypothetical protein
MRSVLRLTRSWVALAIVSCGPWAMSPSVVAAEQPVARDDATSMPLGLGGVGGVYLAAEPGELVIEVQKRDCHRRQAVTELRAILAGPDRHVLQEVTIPDDGRPAGSGLGPLQRTRLSARVPRSGVYVLNVTVSNDRYGEEAIWGFTTNCPHYARNDWPGSRRALLVSPDGGDTWKLADREEPR